MTELSSFNYDLTRVVHGPGGINEMAHVKFGEVCAHGQLRRSCEVCERDVTIEDLRRQLGAYNRLLERVSEAISASIENLRQCDHDCNDRDRAWARMDALLSDVDAELEGGGRSSSDWRSTRTATARPDTRCT